MLLRWQVALWDLRGGRGAPSFGARGPTHHEQVDAVSVAMLISRIPAVTQEAGSVRSAIQDLVLDPQDHRRLAFHLHNGWSGAGP